MQKVASKSQAWIPQTSVFPHKPKPPRNLQAVGNSLSLKKMCPGFAAQAVTRQPFHRIPRPASLRPKAPLGFLPHGPGGAPALLSCSTDTFYYLQSTPSGEPAAPQETIFGPKAHPFLKLGLFPVTPSFEQKIAFQSIWRNAFPHPHPQCALKVPVKPRGPGVGPCLVLLSPAPW